MKRYSIGRGSGRIMLEGLVAYLLQAGLPYLSNISEEFRSSHTLQVHVILQTWGKAYGNCTSPISYGFGNRETKCHLIGR